MTTLPPRSREKLIIAGTLGLLTVVAWATNFYQTQLMPMEMVHAQMGMTMDRQPVFPGFEVLLFLSTWTVMMVAMMLPSAGPMIMTYNQLLAQRRSSELTQTSTLLFVLGYLLAWGGTGLVAYAVNALAPWVVQMLPEIEKYSGVIGGGIFILAGAYQFSALKNLCLSACRTPLGYLLSSWREGRNGAVLMGLHHGLYCIGCCWALMTTMFVVGVMTGGLGYVVVGWLQTIGIGVFFRNLRYRIG